MATQLSSRAQEIKPSPTLVVTARATELRAQGKQIISFAAGEPDFDTPQHIKDAAAAAMQAGQTKYTAVDGTLDLKQAVIDKLSRENQLDYELPQILVSCGAKHSLYNLFQAVLNPDDEVIVVSPYWVSYPDMIKLAGAKPVIIDTKIEDNFKLNPSALSAAISAKTRLIIFNNPNNPTGMCYSTAELEAFGKILLDHPDIIVVTDDIYEHILWGQDKFFNIVNTCPALYERTVVVNGVSKAYAMTGWRIGYAAGPATIIKAMKNIQSQSTSNPNSIAQAATVAALNGDQTDIKKNIQLFKERHDFLYEALQTIDGVRCIASEGAFYSFIDMSRLIEQQTDIKDDIELARFFLEQAGVAMVPGSAFGAPGYIRISFATSMENLKLGIEKIKAALN